jgi:two-component system chemotaxis response regulator CheB
MIGARIKEDFVDDLRARTELIVMGASAGAIEALLTIIPRLPAGYRLPIAAVVHSPPDKKSAVADLFRSRSKLDVKEAEDKEAIEGGKVYFAPPNYHLLVESGRYFSLSADAPVMYSRPAIDLLFESAADAYGPNVLGVVLTGANSDGAAGLRRVCESGGFGVVQDPAEAYSPVMPQAAKSACPGAKLMNLEMILALLENINRESGR